MKSTVFKIKAILLSVLILLSNNSYAITSHFCGSELVAVSYTGKDLTCGMETTGDDCDSEKTTKKDCCKDVVEIIESTTLDKAIGFKFLQKQLEFSTAFIYAYYKVFQELDPEEKHYKDFSPPDIDKDYQVLYETFLI